ncbi:MAG: hypothetical protein WKF73_09300 [Nocardioidaceae bacterium]
MTRLTKARELTATLPEAEPASGNEDDAIVQQVAGAIGAWRSAPAVARPERADLARPPGAGRRSTSGT